MLDHNDTSEDNNLAEPLSTYYESYTGDSPGSITTSDDDVDRSRDFSAPKDNQLRDYLLAQLDIRLYTRQEWSLFIILTKESQNWSVQLNDSWIENYQINDYYLKMMNSSTHN